MPHEVRAGVSVNPGYSTHWSDPGSADTSPERSRLMEEPMELRPVVRQSESRTSPLGPSTALRDQPFDRYRTDATQTCRFSAMTRARTAATAAALTATLCLAAASWVVAVQQMKW